MTMTDKGTDVNIAVEMIRHAYEHSYEKAILISRDADFSGVVKIIKSLGMNVVISTIWRAQTKAQELSAEVDKCCGFAQWWLCWMWNVIQWGVLRGDSELVKAFIKRQNK